MEILKNPGILLSLIFGGAGFVLGWLVKKDIERAQRKIDLLRASMGISKRKDF